MGRSKARTPSPAIVIAVLALFAAFGGGAYAASKIGTSDIKTGAVTDKKLAKHAVTGSKLAPITEVKETSPPATAQEITATAKCPSGTRVIAGGFKVSPPQVPGPDQAVQPQRDQRKGNGWRADGWAADLGDKITAIAYCLG